MFILVAHADENIDNNERIGFLKIIRDIEWCESESMKSIFTSTSYFFSEFLLLYHRGKFKKDLKQVVRTFRFVDKIFVDAECKLMKGDLYRLANEVAKASGGIAGFLAVSRSEKKVINELEEIFGDMEIPEENSQAVTG